MWYNGDQPYGLAGFVNDFSSRMVGYATLRQLRVQNSKSFIWNAIWFKNYPWHVYYNFKDSCELYGQFKNICEECTSGLNGANQENNNFGFENVISLN